jgi:hypothetical protein
VFLGTFKALQIEGVVPIVGPVTKEDPPTVRRYAGSGDSFPLRIILQGEDLKIILSRKTARPSNDYECDPYPEPTYATHLSPFLGNPFVLGVLHSRYSLSAPVTLF